MTAFEYFNPVRLLFAEGALDRLGECMKPTDHHALLVTGTSAARKFGYLDRALAQLSQCGIQATVYDAIPPNPTDAVVDEGAQAAREAGCDVVLQCSGVLKEMQVTAMGCRELDGLALVRARAVDAFAKRPPREFDPEAGWARFKELLNT